MVSDRDSIRSVIIRTQQAQESLEYWYQYHRYQYTPQTRYQNTKKRLAQVLSDTGTSISGTSTLVPVHQIRQRKENHPLVPLISHMNSQASNKKKVVKVPENHTHSSTSKHRKKVRTGTRKQQSY